MNAFDIDVFWPLHVRYAYHIPLQQIYLFSRMGMQKRTYKHQSEVPCPKPDNAFLEVHTEESSAVVLPVR